MKRVLQAVISFALLQLLAAQPPPAPQQLTAWPWYKEIQAPPGRPGLMGFVLDREMLDRSRADYADVRLYDAEGHEIPYVLRVRRNVDTATLFEAHAFNRGAQGGAAEVSCDLGDKPVEHNQVEIETTGNNFRRLAEVQGSADGRQWSSLASDAILFRFTAGNRSVEQQAISYPPSRYRYLRIRVLPDTSVDRSAPEIADVRVRRSVQIQGEMQTFEVTMEGRDPDRVDGRPASVFRLNLGARIPVQRLVPTWTDVQFSRPFRLENVDDPSNPIVVASGDLARNQNSNVSQPDIEFSEVYAQHLKLIIIDDRNPPVWFASMTAQSALRQVLFQAADAGANPLRVYYGNYKAEAPRYDLADRIQMNASSALGRLPLSPEHANPLYRPEQLPLSDRAPWLIYVLLSLGCVTLAVILISLVRASGPRSSTVL